MIEVSAEVRAAGMILVLTLVSGVGDSIGFVEAAKVWDNGKLNVEGLIKSACAFGVGIPAYWLAIRYLQRFGVMAPELQALLYFGVSIIGVAMISGKFFDWSIREQVVAALVVAGIGWLLAQARLA